jgi:hypothetical protein
MAPKLRTLVDTARRRNGTIEERLIFRKERRAGDDGLSGVHCPGDLAHSRQRPTPTFIDHLNLTFVAEKPPPSHVFEQVALAAAEENMDYF